MTKKATTTKHCRPEFGAYLTTIQSAGFGKVNEYLTSIGSEKLHAKQQSTLFRVNLPQSVAKEQAVGAYGAGLYGVASGRPVAMVLLSVGKLLVAAAFNPLDPVTRDMMKETAASGKFSCMFEFDIEEGKPVPKNIDHALTAVTMDVFGKSLLTTEGMEMVSHADWLASSTRNLMAGIPTMGVTGELLSQHHFRTFNVLPWDAWKDLPDPST